MSTLDFTLTLSVDGSPVFQSFFEMEGGPGGNNPTVLIGGDDIGTVQNPLNPSMIEIPFSFQKVDLGVVNPGQSILFEYQLDISVEIHDFSEITRFQFEDPLTLNPPLVMPGEVHRASIEFVPEPGSLALLVASGLAMFRRRTGR